MIKNNKYYKSKKTKNGLIEINTNYAKMPQLFRYFSINKYSVNNFMQDEIWGTTPCYFNDPYDSIACYSVKKIKDKINSNIKLYDKEIKILFSLKTKHEIKDIIFNQIIEIYNFYRETWSIACFSVNNDSEIKWAHYANNAKGFLLGYSAQELNECALNTNEIYDNFCKDFIFKI